ncbi:unnamed protein product, partial [Ixodes hexagonus]
VCRYSWQVAVPPTKDAPGLSFMYISLCEPLSFPTSSPEAVCNGKSVCRVTDGKAEVYSDFVANTTNVQVNGAWMFVKGNQCHEPRGKAYKVSLRMICAPDYGSPEFYTEASCQVFLLWRTSAVCPPVPGKPVRTEVPCYVFDGQGSRFDLSGLIRASGGHRVETADPKVDLRINVCSDMLPENGVMYPPMSGACLMKGSTDCTSVGEVHSGLKYQGKDLFLTYLPKEGSPPMPGCEAAPRTTIKFVCPGRRNSHFPRLLSDMDCHYYVEWETQHACSLDQLTADVSTCKFTGDTHGVDIDLSPLQKADGYYNISGMINGSTASLHFNVCGRGLGQQFTCGVRKVFAVAMCLRQGTESISLGDIRDPTLRLVDDVAIMTFRDGSPCKPQVSWSSTIRFICNEDAGEGEMQFDWVDIDTCVYNFAWETAHACPKVRATDCSIVEDGVHIDLSPLSRSKDDTPWTALGAPDGDGNQTFYINVCREIGAAGAAVGCNKRSTVCAIVVGGSNTWRELCLIDADASRYVGSVRSKFMLHKIGLGCELDEFYLILILSRQTWGIAQAVLGRICFCFVQLDRFKGTNSPVSLSTVIPDGAGRTACYGTHPAKPVYDKSSKVVTVTSLGDTCEAGKKYRSVISFICKPGAVTTSPELLREVKSECLLEFEWHTAVACPRKTKIGTNCKISNEQLGFELDFSPLNSPKPYEVEHKGYKYFLNVCGNLTGTPCNTNKQEAGICQVSIANGRSWVLGQANSDLTYIDGMVNLTYVNGTPYNDRAKTPRTSSVVFLCDYDAGVGHPEFLDETNRTYVFVWYTSYACPPSYFTGCIYRDPETNLTYDLSRLNQVMQGSDWFVEEREMDFTRRFHLSVCRPLRHAPSGCSSRAAACIVNSYDNGTELVAVANAGQARHSPVGASGSIALEYDMGEPCVMYGKTTTYTTVIYFLCDARQAESLHLLPKGKCRYTFLWVTHMACPVSHLEARGSCSLTDRAGTTYSLSSLRLPHSFYTVTDGNVVYELNICGPVYGGHCSKMANTSVCRVEGGNATQLARSDIMALTSDDPGSLRLSYASGYTNQSAKASLVLIEATCDRGALNHRLTFDRSEPGLFVFSLSTVLACEPAQVACTFSDSQGYQYDLTPLVRRAGNWDILHPTGSRHFHLSFCKPLNPSTAYSCPPGAASCETDTLHPEKAGVSWGIQTGTPSVTRDKTVVILYRNGSPCKTKDDASELQVSRSTVITLICSDKEEQPIVVGESENCELVFNFETPAACPLKVAEGDNCRVKDPRYGYVYDLSSLANTTSDYEVATANFSYLINVCQPLVTDMEQCKGAAMCQTKPTDATFGMHAGVPNSEVTYKNGLITLTYTEGHGDCKGSNNRSTVISFVCDHSASGRQGPTFISESEDCTYAFEWRTSLACPPIVESECSVQLDNDGGVVDLSPLSNPRDNYVVNVPDGPKYVLNVCRSVVYSPGATCENTAGACAVQNPQSSHSLGQVLYPPYVENGHVMLKYPSGDYCNQRGSRGKVQRMETVIEFICDKSIQAGSPTFDREDRCTVYFQWRTTFACSMKDDIVYRNCTALHPLTGREYDLTPLKSDQAYNVTFKDDSYSLSICGPLPDNLCGPGAGMCLRKAEGGRAMSLGRANADIHFREGVMFLEYTEGELCPGGAVRRSSVVQFACAMAGYSHLGPQLVHVDSDCTYYFIWHTERACSRVLHCTVEEGTERYDLSSLTKSTGRHTVRNMVDPGHVYYINVCRPLHAVAPYHTLANAGLVRVSKTTNGVESLGEVFMEPFNDFQGHVTLLYVNGSQCSFNTAMYNKARVIFVCDPATTAEEPVLLDIDKENCVFIFEWRTNLVCPEIDRRTTPSSDCVFSIPQHGLTFDLSKLAQRGSNVLEVSEPTGEGKFLLDVCGQTPLNVSGCKDSAVCFASPNHEEGYGTLHSFTYFQGVLKVKYTNGTSCSGSEAPFHSAEINFECSHESGVGAPVLEHKYACHSVFTWKTDLVCVTDTQQCTASSGDDFYDLGLLSSISHIWNVTDSKGNTYWLSICNGMKPDQTGGQSCPSSAAVCMKSVNHRDADFTLGKVSSQKIQVTKARELQLSYGGGDPYICQDHLTQHPETVINFVCDPSGSSLGLPEFVSGPTNDRCAFTFHWKSRSACAVQTEKRVLEKNGIIVDKQLNLAIDFSSMLNSTFNATEVRGKDKYVYVISLGNTLSELSPECARASVCQTKEMPAFYRDVGSFSTRNFVVRGSELRLEMASLTRKCGRTSLNVTTVITFSCSQGAGLGSPKFLYESNKCHYLFVWETSLVCHSSLIALDGASAGSFTGADATGSGAMVGIVAAAVVSLVLVSAAIYLLREKIWTLVDHTCYRSFRAIKIPPYHYSKTHSQLHTADENGDTELLTSGSSMNSVDDPNDLHILT